MAAARWRRSHTAVAYSRIHILAAVEDRRPVQNKGLGGADMHQRREVAARSSGPTRMPTVARCSQILVMVGKETGGHRRSPGMELARTDLVCMRQLDL